MVLPDDPHLDLDDIFGVRRATEVLPMALRDTFFDDWRTLTETRLNDVTALHSAATRQAAQRALRNGIDDPLTVAWRAVSQAMTRYLAWKETPLHGIERGRSA